VTRLARVVFAALVVATIGAFFVTQKLKSSPPLVVRAVVYKVFSPDRDARVRKAKVSFFIIRGDTVNVSIVDREGRIVRTLLDGYHLAKRVRITRWWNGRTDGGSIVPDGHYRVRIALIHQGRTIDLAQTIEVDTRAPRPRVVSVEPGAADGPAFLPRDEVDAVTVRVGGVEQRGSRVQVWRTDVDPPRIVAQLRIPFGEDTARWDGTIDGEPAPAGTYLMGVLVADRSGNAGTFPRQVPPRDGHVDGHAGVTIRYLAAAPPLAPVQAGKVAMVFVDARGSSYRWALRRWGGGAVLAHGRATSARLRLRVPRGQSGLHVLTLIAGEHRLSVPLVVRAVQPRSVLVVLPAMTWQGVARLDDDGNGMPDALDLPALRPSVRLARPFTRLPGSLRDGEGALLTFLDASLMRYDLTTDAALATREGPTLQGHAGVVLAGDERWVTPGLRRQLRTYVRAGGRVWSLGVGSLRQGVGLDRGQLLAPTPPETTDALGARPRQPLVRPDVPATITIDLDDPSLGLFAGTGGSFAGYDVYETLAPFAPPAQLLSSAGAEPEVPVIAGWQLGDGIAIHTGLPQLAARARDGDLDAAALVRRIWTILGHGP
jgi:hypothetical protein